MAFKSNLHYGTTRFKLIGERKNSTPQLLLQNIEQERDTTSISKYNSQPRRVPPSFKDIMMNRDFSIVNSSRVTKRLAFKES